MHEPAYNWSDPSICDGPCCFLNNVGKCYKKDFDRYKELLEIMPHKEAKSIMIEEAKKELDVCS